jgi:hypothetical protein
VEPATLLLLSVTTNVPLRLPAAAGVKVTAMLQLEFAARVAPHVVFWLKSSGFAPANAMLAIVNVPVPVLLRVNV